MRSTEEKLIHIPLMVGMDQSSSDRLSPTGTLYEVINCRRQGEGVLMARPGHVALSTTTANPGGGTVTHALMNSVGTNNIEAPSFACQVQSALLVGNTSGEAFAYSTDWKFQGRFSTCLPVRRRYGLFVDQLSSASLSSSDGFGTYPPDLVVTASGYIAVVTLTASGQLHLSMEDSNSVRILYRTDEDLYVKCRLVAVADVVYLVTQLSGSTQIHGRALTISSGTVTTGAKTLLYTMRNAVDNWDVSNYDGTSWCIAVVDSLVPVIYVSMVTALTVGATITQACTGSPSVTIWGNSTDAQVWVGFLDNPGVTGDAAYAVFSSAVPGALTLVKGKTTIASGVNKMAPMFGRYRGLQLNTTKQAFYCFGEYGTAPNFLARTWVGYEFGSATAGSGAIACWHVLPIAKPDNYNRFWGMLTTATASTNQLTTRMVLLRFPRIQNAPTLELSGPQMPYPGSVPQFIASTRGWFCGSGGAGTSSNAIALPLILQQLNTQALLVKMDVLEYTSGLQEAHRCSLPVGLATTIAGQPVEFWGQSTSEVNLQGTGAGTDAPALPGGASEIGFPNPPIIASATPAGAGAMEPGVRSYRCVFEWADVYGRRHQSAPSAPVSVTTTGAGFTNLCTLVISTLDVSQRQVRNTGLLTYVRVYRTVVGGTEYHELQYSALASSSATGIITFVDQAADAAVAANPFLYTDGGVLANDLAPSCRFICKSEERVWFGGLWDGAIIQCSKVIVPGEPIQCSDDPSHQVILPSACTGLAYMDGGVMAFTADAIYLISGDGPNDQGAGSFPAPRALTRSVGCCSYKSIVETNVGVFFQGNLGIYLVPRGFGPAQYVGKAVQDLMVPVSDTIRPVLGAAAHQTRDNHVARFLLGAPGGGSDSVYGRTVLTFDIDDGQWFEDSLPYACSEIGTTDSMRVNGYKGAVFVNYDLASATLVESSGVYQDGATQVQPSIETAWIHPFGLGGWGKVNAVMVAVEPLGLTQDLNLQVFIDDDTVSQSGLWTVTGPVVAGTGVVNYRAVYLERRACTSIKITVDGATEGALLAGFKFISLTLEIEPTGGIRLLADSERK